MKYLKLFESPDNMEWYDSNIQYLNSPEYPLPFSICFKKEYDEDANKRVWNKSDYVGVIIGVMVGHHNNDVFGDNDKYSELHDKYGNLIRYGNSINGRLWLKRKYISIWNVTKKEILFKGLKEVENILTQKIEEGEKSFNKFISHNDTKYYQDFIKMGLIKDGKFKIFNNGFKMEIRIPDHYDNIKYELIPLEKYVGGASGSERDELDHLKSPMKKGSPSKRIPGWTPHKMKYKMPGEPEIFAKRRLKYMYQEKLTTKFKLFESPDNITLVTNNNYLLPISNAYQKDARAFGYFDNELRTGTFHSTLIPKNKIRFTDEDKIGGNHKEGKTKTPVLEPKKVRKMLVTPGRIWLKQKYISFWGYPKTNNELKNIIFDLEKKFRLNIWNNPEWKIEVLLKPKNSNDKNFNHFVRTPYEFYFPNDLDWDIKYLTLDIVPMLIPVKDYNPQKRTNYEFPTEKEIKISQKLMKKQAKKWKKIEEIEKLKLAALKKQIEQSEEEQNEN